MKYFFTLWILMLVTLWAQPELTNTEATNIDAANERQAWREALELWTDDSPIFTGGTYTGNLLVNGKLNVGNGALDDTHIVNFVSDEDVVTEVMLHLEWNSPTPLAGDSNALLFSMYDSALNETEYSRFRSVIEDPTDGSEDGAMTVDVLNNGVLEQAVLFSHDEIIMNDNGADRNFIVKDNTTAEVLRITGGTGSIAMDADTLFVDSAGDAVGINTASPASGYLLDVAGSSGNIRINDDGNYLEFTRPSANYLQASNAAASIAMLTGSFSQARSLILLNDGNVGIGTFAATNKLQIGSGSIGFTANSGTWDGATIAGNQTFSNDVSVTGDLTVDTDTLFVDASQNWVGFATTSKTGGYVEIGGSDAEKIYYTRGANSWRNSIGLTGDFFYRSSANGSWNIQNSAGAIKATISANTGDATWYGTHNFSANSGSWDGATIAGAQTFSNDATISSKLILDTNGGSGTEGIIAFDDGYGTPTLILQTGGDIITFQDGNNNGSYDAFETVFLNYSIGGGVLGLGGTDPYNPVVSVSTNSLYMGSTPQIYGAFEVADQVELTYQSANTDSSAMNHELVRDFSSVWGNVYKYNSGETDTSNKLSTVSSGDRYFNFSCYTGTSAGDGQWTTFQAPTFGINYGSGGKGQLRDNFSYKFKFDSNTVTNTDVDLWLIRGKTANATLPTASDVCFALKFEGEENLMIAVYDGVTAHTTTIDVSTIDAGFTNLASQQEFIWTWNGSIAKVYGRYRKPVGSGGNDWSAWETIGSLTPSGMASSLTNLSYAGLHFLQHTPVTCTAYTKNYIIWDLEHTTHVITPN
jgi:hypothetical protein